jgi:ABC-2 type transport system permease protein
MLSAIQVLLAVGVVYGLSYLIPNIDPTTALYLATGAPTLGLLVLGLNVVPQEVSQARVAGRADYVKALPVPRLAPLASEVTFWLLVQFPGTVLSLVIASVRFDIDFQVGWMVAPAILLVALSAASVGYAIAVTLSPEVTNQVTAFVSIAILLFSPINFPAEQLPSALQRIHDVLPVQYMADVVRGSLTGQYSDSAAVAFSVVAAWCAAGLAVSYRAATRRG